MTKTTVDVTATLAEVAVSAVIGGVDTHGEVHVVAAVDQVGRVLRTGSFPVSVNGYAAVSQWLASFDAPVLAVGVEGTGSYGAGLSRALTAAGLTVVEVDRPDRSARRRQGKNDDLDAICAARAVLAGRASGTPKTRTGAVEAIRALRVARAGAVKARTAALNQLGTLRISAPALLRAELEALSLPQLARHSAHVELPPATRPGRRGPRPDPVALADPLVATRIAMRQLGHRIAMLDTEIAEANAQLDALVADTAPATLALFGAGTDSVGQLLVTCGDNPDRLHSEAALARLLGVAPIPASSGNTHQHRLHRGGDRAGNAAIHRIVISRLRHHEPTQTYAKSRSADNLTTRMIIRCLKRYVVREVYRAITTDLATINSPQLAT